MSLASHGKKLLEFPHFQIYYDLWVQSFKKPADLLALFYHYLLIHNRFRCVEDDDQETDYLPTLWNSAHKDFYKLMYRKSNINYRLEIQVDDNDIYMNLKRLNDSMDTLQHFKISDYTNIDDYNNADYHISYKSMDHFYQKFQWSIDAIKPPRFCPKFTSSSETLSTNCQSSSSSMSSLTSAATNLVMRQRSNLLLSQIKQEKISLDNELEAYRQQCIITAQKEREKKEAERQKQLKAKAASAKSIKLYDYNPITHYYRYNSGVNDEISVDASNCLNDQFYKESFEKYNLKPARLSVIDCLKDGLLKDTKIPVLLTKEMKEELNLNAMNSNKSKNPRAGNTVNKQKRKRIGSKSINLVQNSVKRQRTNTKPEQEENISANQRLSAASGNCLELNNDAEMVMDHESPAAVSLLENTDKIENTTVDLSQEETVLLNEQNENVNTTNKSKSSVEESMNKNAKGASNKGNWLTDYINKTRTQTSLPPEEDKENNNDEEIIDESFTSCLSKSILSA